MRECCIFAIKLNVLKLLNVMFVGKLKLLIIVAALAAGSFEASAAVRNFFAPSLLGDRISFCVSRNSVCGKPVADAWCVHRGFDRALTFQRESAATKSETFFARAVDTGEGCKGKSCTAFRQIKCYSRN